MYPGWTAHCSIFYSQMPGAIPKQGLICDLKPIILSFGPGHTASIAAKTRAGRCSPNKDLETHMSRQVAEDDCPQALKG